ncbi:hypothetical protein AVEN_34495-1 [Araneus ventricosus]|uniref:Uncharacterized protein n=1 Tax=Araneus ventricosus TaxID=182803 RepID=A0A4Y2KJ48_ARAVE|nr:hypothetical protein AVEN_34495-1 [Araneus ventricosus]
MKAFLAWKGESELGIRISVWEMGILSLRECRLEIRLLWVGIGCINASQKLVFFRRVSKTSVRRWEPFDDSEVVFLKSFLTDNGKRQTLSSWSVKHQRNDIPIH